MSWFSARSTDSSLVKNLETIAGVLDEMERYIGSEELEKFSSSVKGDDVILKFERINITMVAGREKKDKKAVALRIASHFFVELLVDGSHVFYVPVDPKTNAALYRRLCFHRKRAVEVAEEKKRADKAKAESDRVIATVEREKSVADRIREIFS